MFKTLRSGELATYHRQTTAYTTRGRLAGCVFVSVPTCWRSNQTMCFGLQVKPRESFAKCRRQMHGLKPTCKACCSRVYSSKLAVTERA